MAKKVVATLKKSDSRGMTKAIKITRSPKTGAYVFKEEIIFTDNVKEHFAKKQ